MINDDHRFLGEALYRCWIYRGHRIVLYWWPDAATDMAHTERYPEILAIIGDAFLWYIGQVALPPTAQAPMADPVEVYSKWVG